MVSLYEFLPALLTQIQTSCLAIIFLLKPFRPLLPGDSLINLCFSMFSVFGFLRVVIVNLVEMIKSSLNHCEIKNKKIFLYVS
jgi:hypothetical protein